MQILNTKTTKILHLLVVAISAVAIKYYFNIHGNTKALEPGYLVFGFLLSTIPLVGYCLDKTMIFGFLSLKAENREIIPRAILMFACVFLAIECIDSLIFHYNEIT